MNTKLFFQIHNEGNNKRYYYQPVDIKHPNRPHLLKRWGRNLFRWYKAACLPFNTTYNTQQFQGSRKSKLQMVWENLV